VDELSAACSITIDRNDPALRDLQATCDELDILLVVGFAENGGNGENFNTAALLESGRPARFYRKAHLPLLGYDRFSTGGDDLPVFETRLGKLGVLICYDIRFPEAARVLALKGADLIVLPTNWPSGAEISAEVLSIARAAENRVYLATCNRVGTENGFTFIGLSKIIDPNGKVLAAAGPDETVIIADLDFDLARQKTIVRIPGKYETDVFGARRQELYGELSSGWNP
jgi:predicted amidohydrolase